MTKKKTPELSESELKEHAKAAEKELAGPGPYETAVGHAWVEFERAKSVAKQAYDRDMRPVKQAYERAVAKAEKARDEAITVAPKN